MWGAQRDCSFRLGALCPLVQLQLSQGLQAVSAITLERTWVCTGWGPLSRRSQNRSQATAASPAKQLSPQLTLSQQQQLAAYRRAAELQQQHITPAVMQPAQPASQPTMEGPSILTSEAQAAFNGGYSTGVSTLPTGQGFKKT